MPAAVNQGIWQCISLFTKAPPKGKRENFGLAALRYWTNMLTNTRNFLLDERQRITFCQRVAELVTKIHDLEQETVKCLQDAMA